MKNVFLLLFLECIVSYSLAQESVSVFATSSPKNKLSGFVSDSCSAEQEMVFVYKPGIKIHVNAPSKSTFDANKPTKLVLYALPNGNSTAWTIGKLPEEGDDWHYHIQNIGAQTRFLRMTDTECNLVTVYLEAETKSWGRWRKDALDRDQKIKEAVEYILMIFSECNPHIELNSHSGGGNFIFGFMDVVSEIPDYVKRISFIDSNYNWEHKRYGDKLKQWLLASKDNSLFVACYDDANALLDGKPFVSQKGGTWHRTYLMQRYLRKYLKRLKWSRLENDSIIYYTANDRKIQFYFRKNPERAIYHTILVERNGYIQSVLSGTKYEGVGYQFMKKRVYDDYQ